MQETLERVGLAQIKNGSGTTVMFHRLKIKLSRKYRIWWVPGDLRSELMDPSEFTAQFCVLQEHKVEPAPNIATGKPCNLKQWLRDTITTDAQGNPVCHKCGAPAELIVGSAGSGGYWAHKEKAVKVCDSA